MTDTVAAYLATWNETDRDVRRTMLMRHWAQDARYTDPLVDVAGHDDLDATIVAVQDQFAGSVFTRLGEVDAHHDQTRFRWGLGPVGAVPLVEGFDVVVTDEDGRITRVHGFLDKVPTAG